MGDELNNRKWPESSKLSQDQVWRNDRQRIATNPDCNIWGLSPYNSSYDSSEDEEKKLEERRQVKKKEKLERKKQKMMRKLRTDGKVKTNKYKEKVQKHKKNKKSKKEHKKINESRKKFSGSISDTSDNDEFQLNKAKDNNNNNNNNTKQESKISGEKSTKESNDILIGPQPLSVTPTDSSKSSNDYGKLLRPGEGEAMATFVKEGKRIPRRGEIGMTGEEIERFESEGWVLSGGRNYRMEAVR